MTGEDPKYTETNLLRGSLGWVTVFGRVYHHGM